MQPSFHIRKQGTTNTTPNSVANKRPGSLSGRKLIPRDEWREEADKSVEEERLFWKGKKIYAELLVELPFWLCTEDMVLNTTIKNTTLNIALYNDYYEVYEGPSFHDSRETAIYLGNEVSLQQLAQKHKLVYPSFRKAKTVLGIKCKVVENAFTVHIDDLKMKFNPTTTEIRGINRSLHYFDTLILAHFPFINKLIRSYSNNTYDPNAFEISPWSNPVWYLRRKSNYIKVHIFPNLASDSPPTINNFEGSDSRPYYTITPDNLRNSINEKVLPGLNDLLIAISLWYQGRYEDSIRSAVTCIEVAVESVLVSLWEKKGFSKTKIKKMLFDSRMDFESRLNELEQLRDEYCPGPIVHEVPYIFGIDFKEEALAIRSIRHKIVHHGLKISLFENGLLHKVIDVTKWLHSWLTNSKQQQERTFKNSLFFFSGTFRSTYGFKYTRNYAIPVSRERPDVHEQLTTSIYKRMYENSVKHIASNPLMFAMMSLCYLGINPVRSKPSIHKKYSTVIYECVHLQTTLLVLHLNKSTIIDESLINAIATIMNSHIRKAGTSVKALVIFEKSFAAGDLNHPLQVFSSLYLRYRNICLINCRDLHDFVVNSVTNSWGHVETFNNLQNYCTHLSGMSNYQKIGSIRTTFQKHSIISINLDTTVDISEKSLIAFYQGSIVQECEIESIQMNKANITSATGICNIGVKIKNPPKNVSIGTDIFLRLDSPVDQDAHPFSFLL